MTIKETHNFITFVLNKEVSGYVSPTDIDRALDRAQMSKFVELYGNPKGYQPGRPIPPIAYGMTQKIADDLRKFKKVENYTTSVGAGNIIDLTTLADEYIHLIGLNNTQQLVSHHKTNFSVSNGIIATSVGTPNVNLTKNVTIVDEDELADRLISQICEPDEFDPIAILGDGGTKLQLYPLTTAHNGQIFYLRRPKKPFFSHVVDGRKIIHNPSNSAAINHTATNALTAQDGSSVAAGNTTSVAKSQDLEWPEDVVQDIISRALNILGVHLEDSVVTQFGELKTQQGQ